MKKLVFSILTLAVVALAGNNAAARNVTVAEAAQAGACYMEHNTMQEKVLASDFVLTHTIESEMGPAAYCFNVSDWGWIIMAASTVVDPVVAFAEGSTLAEWESLPPAMREWCEGYAAMIGYLQKVDVDEHLQDVDEWNDLFNDKVGYNAKDGDPRVILMTSFWDQGENRNPTYNYYCPQDPDNGKYCYTGCVATAMAQIIRYYGFPIEPKGRKNYYTDTYGFNLRLKFDTLHFDYSQMPDRLFTSSTQAQIHNVAMLSYACGVAVTMDYTPSGSGTQSRFVPDAMSTHFKYVTPTRTARSDVSTSTFIGLIRDDLMLRRPVYMSGSSPVGSGADAAGHAWVCCGFRTDNEKQYYMNWGWSGAGDGFFNIWDNTQNGMYIQGMGYAVTQSHNVITGIIPPSPDSTNVDFMTPISVVEDNTVLAPAYPNPAVFSVTLPYAVTHESEMQVFAIDGKMVATRRLMPGNGQVTLDVRSMPAGIYIYRVGGQSGKFIVR